jgi:hypothetical protein
MKPLTLPSHVAPARPCGFGTRPSPVQCLRRSAAGVVAAVGLAAAVQAAPPAADDRGASNAPPSPLDFVFVPSVFEDSPASGTDPFFPKSGRRALLNLATNQSAARVEIPDLVLKGISGPRHRRLALINNYTFGVGEEADIRVGGQNCRVKLVEVRDQSVVVSIKGQTRELNLRKGL